MHGSIRDFISFLQMRNTPGKSIDHFVCATDIARQADRAMLLIRLESLEQIVHMCRQADHVLCIPSGGKTYAGALYSDVSNFPIARFYHMRLEGDLVAAAQMFKLFTERGFRVEIPRPETLSALVQEGGWEARLADHLEYRKARVQDYEKLRSGRCRSTVTDSTLFLNSTGCLICDGPPDFVASMTFATAGESAFLTAIRLCSTHMAEAREDSSLANYLARTFDIPFLLEGLSRSPSEVLSDGGEIMQSKLELDVFNHGTKVIKGKTRKGTVLIYRYEGELNYGYMINSVQNEELARIDSANHHRVEVGPDHLHPDLQKNAPPVSSFTTGDLCLDWPLIKHLIVDWESR